MYLLSGGPAKVEDKPVLEQTSHVNSAKWAFRTSTRVTDTFTVAGCELYGLGNPQCEITKDPDRGPAILELGIVGAIGTAAAAGAVALVGRRE